MTSSASDALPVEGHFESRAAFVASVRQCFATLAERGANEVWICDADFADWPLNEPEVIEHLTRWCRPSRVFNVLASDYSVLERRCARWVEWRRVWSHLVRCRAPEESSRAIPLPTLLVAPGVATLRLFDRRLFRGDVSLDAVAARRELEALDAVLQRSTDSFPAHTLGL
jgi:hypothetical protein